MTEGVAKPLGGTVRFWPQSPEPWVASTRIRCHQVIQGLRGLGVDAGLYQPGERPDMLILLRRYDDDTVAQAVALREQAGTRVLLDLCDNHFYAQTDAPKWRARAQRLQQACEAADGVVAASRTLADAVRQACGPEVVVSVVPDPLDRDAANATERRGWEALHALRLRAFQAWQRTPAGRRLLWFGNHGAQYAGGGMEDIHRVSDALAAHHQAQPVSLLVVSNRWKRYRALSREWPWPSLYLPWSGANFALALQHSDIALIPAQRNPFTLCKTNNRLATAFLHGLAVAADALPSYEEFRDVAVLDDWAGGLGRLMASADARRASVTAARARLEHEYDAAAIARRWLDVLASTTTRVR